MRHELFRRLSQEERTTAKGLLAKGLSLSEASFAMGCLPRDLDLALWVWIGESESSTTPEPMFQ